MPVTPKVGRKKQKSCSLVTREFKIHDKKKKKSGVHWRWPNKKNYYAIIELWHCYRIAGKKYLKFRDRWSQNEFLMHHRPNFYLPGTLFILSFIGKWPERVGNWGKWIAYNPKDLGTKNGKQRSWISGGEEFAGVFVYMWKSQRFHWVPENTLRRTAFGNLIRAHGNCGVGVQLSQFGFQRKPNNCPSLELFPICRSEATW